MKLLRDAAIPMLCGAVGAFVFWALQHIHIGLHAPR
jgi:hypothetical protein